MKTSYLVPSQLPEFIRADYEKFVDFLKAYYEFVDEQQLNIMFLRDVDYTATELLMFLRRELAANFPAFSIDERRAIRLVRELITRKGTNDAFKLLFRMFFNEAVTIRKPSEQILKASDGRWVKYNFITLNAVTGDIDAVLDNSLLEARNEFGVFQVRLIKVEKLSPTVIRCYFASTTNLEVIDYQECALYVGDELVFVGKARRSPSRFTIVRTDPGFQIGRVFLFDASVSGTIAKVNAIGPNGELEFLQIVDYGYFHDFGLANYFAEDYTLDGNYTLDEPNPTLEVSIDDGLGSTADLIFESDWIVRTYGNFEGDTGRVSNPVIVLQDNYFFQLFSYVIDTQQNIEVARPYIEQIHPAGLKYFFNLTKIQQNDESLFIDSEERRVYDDLWVRDVVDMLEDEFRDFVKNLYYDTVVGTDRPFKTFIKARTDATPGSTDDEYRDFTKVNAHGTDPATDDEYRVFTKKNNDTLVMVEDENRDFTKKLDVDSSLMSEEPALTVTKYYDLDAASIDDGVFENQGVVGYVDPTYLETSDYTEEEILVFIG